MYPTPKEKNAGSMSKYNSLPPPRRKIYLAHVYRKCRRAPLLIVLQLFFWGEGGVGAWRGRPYTPSTTSSSFYGPINVSTPVTRFWFLPKSRRGDAIPLKKGLDTRRWLKTRKGSFHWSAALVLAVLGFKPIWAITFLASYAPPIGKKFFTHLYLKKIPILRTSL